MSPIRKTAGRCEWSFPGTATAPGTTGHPCGRHVVKAPHTGQGLLRVDVGSGGGDRFTIETLPATADASDPDGLEEALSRYATWGARLIGTLRAPIPGRGDVARLLAERAQAVTGADAFVFSLWSLRGGLPEAVTRQALSSCAPFDADLVLLDGVHHTETVRKRLRLLGEEPVMYSSASGAGTARAVATTSYLAERLGVAARPVVPPRTLRGILTDLVMESL